MTEPGWQALCQAPVLASAVFEHFAPVLATTPSNRDLLQRICEHVKAARVDTSPADARHHSLELAFDHDLLRCYPGETVHPTAVPASYARILALHGRIKLVEAQVDLFVETAVEEEGWLDGTGLEGRGVFAPLRVYADLYIYHPDAATSDGEPRLYFCDHEMVDEDGAQPVDGDIAAVFLRHVAKGLQLPS